MHFYTIKNVPIRSGDVVYRESWIFHLLGLMFSLVLSGAIIADLLWFSASTEGAFRWILSSVAGLFAVLIPLLPGRTLLRALRAQNWIVRARPDGLMIKIRSFQNDLFPPDREVVVEWKPGEIEWLGVTRERRASAETDEGMRFETITYLDIKPLAGDLSPLESRLREERLLKTNARYGNHPVRITKDGVVRLTWRASWTWVTPKVSLAAARLARMLRVPLRPEANLTSNLQKAPGDKRARENSILELAESGQTIAAIKATRKLYGLSLSEAKLFVEELQGEGSQSRTKL